MLGEASQLVPVSSGVSICFVALILRIHDEVTASRSASIVSSTIIACFIIRLDRLIFPVFQITSARHKI